MDICSKNILGLLQTADLVKARLQGEFSMIHGLSMNEFIMMLHLENSDMARLSRVELAKRMNVSASTITRMAAPMEKLGLLDRQQDKRDARLAFVLITDAGLQRVAEARATFEKRAKRMFEDQWTDQELQTLMLSLQRLAAYNNDHSIWSGIGLA